MATPVAQTMAGTDSHLSSRWELEATPREVFDLIADASSYPQWWPSVFLEARIVEPGDEAEKKRSFVHSLGADQVIAIGNGNNDALMLETASLGIAVLGVEGCAVSALTSADLLARNITDALDLLLHPVRLLSSLRH